MGLTQKQIYDLNNMNVAAQRALLGTTIDELIDNGGGGGTGKKMFIQKPFFSDFPVIGDVDVIYADMSKNFLYRWDTNVKQYYIVGTDYNQIIANLMSKSSFATNSKANQGYVDKAIRADEADKLSNKRTLSVQGDVEGVSSPFDGSSNATLNLSLNATGVTPGVYTVVTIGSDGRVTHAEVLKASDIPDLTLSKITDAGTAAKKNVGMNPGEIPLINSEGKFDSSIIPYIPPNTIIDSHSIKEFKIWIGTQEEYEALSTKNLTTIYITK